MTTQHVSTINMKLKPFTTACTTLLIYGLLLANVLAYHAMAQDDHSHATTAQHHEATSTLSTQASALIKLVRDSTARFQDVAEAEKEGYLLQFGCVSGPDSGAMGLHYVNGSLVNGGVIDATRPQIVIYEPTPSGALKLIGADYLVIAQQWDSDPSHHGPPQLMGQLFHYFEAPNRFGLPAFYTLHVWAWKDNPNGAFVNWHPDVNCSAFTSADAR